MMQKVIGDAVVIRRLQLRTIEESGLHHLEFRQMTECVDGVSDRNRVRVYRGDVEWDAKPPAMANEPSRNVTAAGANIKNAVRTWSV